MKMSTSEFKVPLNARHNAVFVHVYNDSTSAEQHKNGLISEINAHSRVNYTVNSVMYRS